MQATVYLFRHGQTDWNLAKKLQGHSDVALNDTGRAQAKALADHLKNHKIEKFISSDLMRARETAEIIAQYHQQEVFLDQRLREISYGILESMHVGEAHRQAGEDLKKFWTRGEHYDLILPGSNESKRDVIKRSLSVLEECILEDVHYFALSTHSGVIHKTLHSIFPHADPFHVANCSLFVLKYEDEKWELLEHFIPEVK